MSAEIGLFSPSSPTAGLPEPVQASSDDQLVEIWLHGRSVHTQLAYALDLRRFRDRAGKPLSLVKLEDLQSFADSLVGAPASRAAYRTNAILPFGFLPRNLPVSMMCRFEKSSGQSCRRPWTIASSQTAGSGERLFTRPVLDKPISDPSCRGVFARSQRAARSQHSR